ncbi:MAG: hypothetical protein WBP79_06155 [Candidatus Acidiferrales bacterium]
MQSNKSRLWISLAILSLASLLLLAVRQSRVEDARKKQEEARRQADWNTFQSNLKNAENQVHRITGTFNYATKVYDAGDGGGSVEAALSKLPEAHAITYPFLVWSVREDWAGFLLSRDNDRFYFKTPTGTVVSPYIYNDQMHDLRWLVLLTYGVLNSLPYHPQGFDRVQMNQNRIFADAWVVDLENMNVVAHRRFVDDALPDVIRGDEYGKAQQKKLELEIRSWLEKNVR